MTFGKGANVPKKIDEIDDEEGPTESADKKSNEVPSGDPSVMTVEIRHTRRRRSAHASHIGHK